MTKCLLKLCFFALLLGIVANVSAQRRKQPRTIPLSSITLSDPFIFADSATHLYYMTGTGGMLWKSSDLKMWTGPYSVVETDSTSWMGTRPQIWAAEIHQYKGRYYYFATFTNEAIKIDTVRGNVIPRRATHILVSDKAEGPYRPVSKDNYLPENRPTLDGTFWIDTNGHPYMVYCWEWLQNWNGTIEKIRLKEDLSGSVGEGKILFRASDSPWSREKDEMGNDIPNKVTDGPFLFKTQTGRLGMLWTSWVYNDYTQGVAYSESGTLDGPWIQDSLPITPPNYGHGMLFRTFEGRLMMSVHSHQNFNGHYHRVPHIFPVDDSGDKIKVNDAPFQWGTWQRYGSMGDGTYCNPILPFDFSDIDCIQHKGFYYAISSTFQFSPGMVILRSRDMVNWEVVSHAVQDLTQISKAMNYDVMDRYARGIWAGAIRYHKGLFYVYFGCPDEGMFMTTAKKIEGPWAPLTKMTGFEGGWDDCCPLFDAPSTGSGEVSQNYFVATHYADGYKTYIFQLSADGKSVDWNSRVLINEGYGREANKLYKFGGKYYHLFSQHKDGGRYLMMQRADNPMGPYTASHQLSYTQRQWNEPNQGGFLQDDAGKWFFLTHHGTGDWGGRVASLLPVTWASDGWPVVGEPDSNNVGRMVWRHTMPACKDADNKKNTGFVITCFTAPDMEWNYQPRKDMFSMKKHSLVLRAFRPLETNNLLKAVNTLTWRSGMTPKNEAVVCMDLSKMAEGQRSGLCHFSASWSEFGVKMENGQRVLYYRDNTGKEDIIATGVPALLYLRSIWGLDAVSHYAWSLDGKQWNNTVDTYRLQWGNYRGDRCGLYTYNNIEEKGEAVFNHFTYTSAPIQ